MGFSKNPITDGYFLALSALMEGIEKVIRMTLWNWRFLVSSKERKSQLLKSLRLISTRRNLGLFGSELLARKLRVLFPEENDAVG